ncbi:MAG: hypothetical protein GX259_09725 [Bacteroidales bacterium]|nr:hypothetical protein [Bacteroidales bacterium]
MKPFNAEKTIYSRFKLFFILFCITLAVFLIFKSSKSSIFSLNTLLGGIIKINISLPFSVIAISRLVLIIISSFIAKSIAVKIFKFPSKDYFVFVLISLSHFFIKDWNVGLTVAIYWTYFVIMVHNLFLEESLLPSYRKTLNTALLGGILLLNGPFVLLFFIAGIVIMISYQYFSCRRLIIWLIGYIFPLFLVFFWCFLQDKTNIIFENFKTIFVKKEYFQFAFEKIYFLHIISLIILIGIVLIKLKNSKISERKAFLTLIITSIVLLLGIFTSTFNCLLLLHIYSLLLAFFWARALHKSQTRVTFIIILIIPFIFPILSFFF